MIRVASVNMKSNIIKKRPWVYGNIKLFLKLSIFVISILSKVVTCLDYNKPCLKGCKCGIFPSELTQDPLITLECSFARIKIFPKQLSKELEVLNLRGNSIFNINESISDLTNLRELNLSGNRIKSIRGQFFRNMLNLTYLNIGKNDISTIHHIDLKGPKHLKKLILSNNKINYIEDKVFDDLKDLQSLDLEQNFVGTLYEDWFVGMDSLLNLDLSHNRIHSIQATVFRQLPSLEDLNLVGNRISSIDTRAFSGLINLKTLSLDDNLIARIPTAAFESLPGLKTLSLNNNPLTKVKTLDFSHLSVIQISLSQMSELSIIDAKAFYSLENLTSLFINYNHKLTYVDPLAFMNTEKLSYLELHDNNLKGIQSDIVQYLPNGTKVTLYGNPFCCDCNVRWLRRMTGDENATLIIEEAEHLICDSPPVMKGKLIKDLDLLKFPKVCAPSILNLTRTSEVSGKVGEQKVLECRALGEPKPRLYWVIPNGDIINSTLNEVRQRFFPPGTLAYYHLKPSDAGPFTCVAENVVDEVSGVFNLTVTGIDIHLFPVATSSNFITLVWNGTERRIFSEYKIKYAEYNRDNESISKNLLTTTVSSSRKTFTISHLKSDTEYEFCIGHEYITGYWQKLSCCIARTQNARFMLQGITHSKKTTVAAVIGFILVFSLTFCLISLASRRYRQRFYESPDKAQSTSSSMAAEENGSHIPLDNLYKPLLSKS